MITREEAASKGLKRFFTAVACFRGHECERLVSNGLCIECARLNKKADKERNPERERARRRKYAAENPERVKAWRKATEARHGKRVQKRDQRGKSKLLQPESDMFDNLITGIDFKRSNPKADRAFWIGPYLEADIPPPRFAPWPCEHNTEYIASDEDCA